MSYNAERSYSAKPLKSVLKPVTSSLIALAALTSSPAALANDTCELIEEYNYNQLLILTSVTAEQANILRNTYTTTLAENSINWSLADGATASGRYPLFVQYYAGSARKLRILFASIQLPTGNLRGDGNVGGHTSFTSSYDATAQQQRDMEKLLGGMINNDKVSVQYDADSMTMNGYTIYHDLVDTYLCMHQ